MLKIIIILSLFILNSCVIENIKKGNPCPVPHTYTVEQLKEISKIVKEINNPYLNQYIIDYTEIILKLKQCRRGY